MLCILFFAVSCIYANMYVKIPSCIFRPLACLSFACFPPTCGYRIVSITERFLVLGKEDRMRGNRKRIRHGCGVPFFRWYVASNRRLKSRRTSKQHGVNGEMDWFCDLTAAHLNCDDGPSHGWSERRGAVAAFKMRWPSLKRSVWFECK